MVLHAQVGAAGSGEQFSAGGQRRLPVEDHRVVQVADEDAVARNRARLVERFLDPEPLQPVGEVAHGFVVGEVGLAHPTGRPLPHHSVCRLALGRALLADREPGVINRLGPQHDSRLDDRFDHGPSITHVTGERERQLLQTGASDRRDDVHLEPPRLQVGAHQLSQLQRFGDIGLVEHDDPGAFGQRSATQCRVGDIERQLALDDVKVGHRVAPRLKRRAVDDVHEHRAPLDVPQELQPQALALVRPRNEAGHVGDGVALRPRRHDAEVGHQGRERIVGDLRPRGRQHRHERGLACGREADEPDVGERLELEHDVGGLAGLAEQRETGGLASRRGQRLVAQPPAATPSDDVLGAHAQQVDDDGPVEVLEDGAFRDRQDQVVALGAVPLVATTGFAVRGASVRAAVVVQQRRRLRVDPQDDRATLPPVAAVGPAEGLELLAFDRCDAVPAVTSGDVQGGSVDELRRHGGLLRSPGWVVGCHRMVCRAAYLIGWNNARGASRHPARPSVRLWTTTRRRSRRLRC